MSEHNDLHIPPPPSTKQLATATAVGLIAATIILLTVVLPAEYGIDPLGTGAALGFAPLAQTESAQARPPISERNPTPVQIGPLAYYAAEYKVDGAQFELGPYEYLEYKYRLEKGATMLYSWEASAKVIHDFHGERDGAKPGSSESFDKQDRGQAHGMLEAPFPGLHGWYWENPGGKPITIRITSAGFYSAAVEIRMDHKRLLHDLTAVRTTAGSPTPIQ